MYQGFLMFAGTEIINAARTFAYARDFLPGLTIHTFQDCDNVRIAMGDAPYASPTADDAPWVNPDDSRTFDFYGVYPLSMEGFDDSTTTATVTQLMTDGSVTSMPRAAGRELRISALLLAANEGSLDAGLQWLNRVLDGDGCGGTCQGDSLCFFVGCPPLCEDSPELHDPENPVPAECDGSPMDWIDACTLPYLRTLYKVKRISGPTITQRYNSRAGAMVQVEFVLSAGVPWRFSPVYQAVWADTSANSFIHIDAPCDVVEEPTLVRTNLAPNPAPIHSGGWTNASTLSDRRTVTRVNNIVRRSNSEAVRSVRTSAGLPFNNTLDPGNEERIMWLQGLGQTDSTRIAVVPGAPYTASVFVRTNIASYTPPSPEASADRRDVMADLEINYYTSGGSLIRVDAVSTKILQSGKWYEVWVSAPAPANAATARVDFSVWVHGYHRSGLWVQKVAAGQTAWAADFLFEQAPANLGYFDGSFPATIEHSYSWDATPNQSVSEMYQLPTLTALDPDCPPIPPPPRPPVVDVSCVEEIDTWLRHETSIDGHLVPMWSHAEAVTRITNNSEEGVRQIRVRLYPDPFGFGIAGLEECEFCGEFVISYLPPGATIEIDGVTRTATYTLADGSEQSALPYLYATDGGPMQWPSLTCGVRYAVAVDVPDDNEHNLEFVMCLAAAE